MNVVGLGRRPLLVMVLGWVAVVGAVGAITFVVVSGAGRGVGQASALEQVVVATTTPSGPTSFPPPSSTTTPTLTPSSTPTHSMTPTPSATPTPPPEPDSTDEPDSTPQPRPTKGGPGPSAPAVDPHTASFNTDGGTLVASCDESRIILQSIRPRDGWRFERGISRFTIEVTFKSPDQEVEIHLSCVDEVPTRAGHLGAAHFEGG